MQCAVLDHRTGAHLSSIYLTIPGLSRFSIDRWRMRLCLRHSRQLLGGLYRRGVDEVTEDQEPEFCLGCGEPTNAQGFEISYYEADWSARFACVACDTCKGSPVTMLNFGSVTAEKLPPRENMTSRGLAKNGRK
jgi:hypothetical protein